MIYRECTNPAKRSFYTRAERERLRTALEAPADTLVWLGRQERSSLAWCEARRLFASHPCVVLLAGRAFVWPFSPTNLPSVI